MDEQRRHHALAQGQGAKRRERRRLDFGFCVINDERRRFRHIGANGRRRGLRNLAHRAAGRFLDRSGSKRIDAGTSTAAFSKHPGQGDENHRRIIRR